MWGVYFILMIDYVWKSYLQTISCPNESIIVALKYQDLFKKLILLFKYTVKEKIFTLMTINNELDDPVLSVQTENKLPSWWRNAHLMRGLRNK